MKSRREINEYIRLAAIEEFVDCVKIYIDLEHIERPEEKCFSETDVVLIVEKIARELKGESNVGL